MNSYFIFCASDFYLPNVTALASSLKFTHLFASDTASYLVTMVFVVVGVILFATVAHKSIAKATVWITVHRTARQTVVSNENNKESAR